MNYTTILTTLFSDVTRTDGSTRRALAHPPGFRAILKENLRQILFCLLVTAFLTAACVLLVPLLSRFWAHASRLLIQALGLPLQLGASHEWIIFIGAADTSPAQMSELLPWHALGAVLFTLLSRLILRPPFRSFFMALGLFHLFNTGLMAVLPNAYPYSIADHTRYLSLFTLVSLALLPTVMALTHAIIERNHERRIFATVLIAAYFIVSLPLKLVAHASIIYLCGRLITPVLFIAFGPAFDIVLFTTLYAYVVTWRHNPDAPEQA